MDVSLFPKREEWGTGDEALDMKLSASLRETLSQLSLESIAHFYTTTIQIKTRAYNPTFQVTIELLIKALLYSLSPETPIDQSLVKLKGAYAQKKKIPFVWNDKDQVLQELKEKKLVRYQSQIDFSILTPEQVERNPYIRESIKRSEFELHTKIIFKDFKNYLSDEGSKNLHTNDFFQSLRLKETVLVIDQFAEIWFHEGLLYTLPKFSLLS